MSFSYYTPFVLKLAFSLIIFGSPSIAVSQEPSSQTDLANSREIVVAMESYVFSPSEITVNAGETFTLILHNQSFLVPHNFLLDDPSGTRVLDVDISSGDSQTHTLTLKEPGTYPFYCDKQLLFFPTHREEGMEGRLIVQ